VHVLPHSEFDDLIKKYPDTVNMRNDALDTYIIDESNEQRK
jgi:hypothetical protein